MPEATYYFSSRHATEVWTDPDNAVDNNLETDASTTVDAQVQRLIGNTCPGTNLGVITKVEIRAYAHGDGDDQLIIRPEFTGGQGNNHTTVPTSSPAWGAYQEITSDPNAPDWSSWSHIQDLDCDIELNDVAKGNTMYCAKVEIRVTYFVPGPPTVTTQAVDSILKTKALGHGNITDTGGENCSKRGVCWNTTGNPTVADSKSEETDSFGTGAFSRQMTGLSAGEHYYVKAYAYNSEGYGYGSQVEFDTLPTNSEVLFPNAAGYETNIQAQFPSSGAHWEKVDEDSPDDSDTYVHSAGVPYQRDLYNLPASSGSGTIDKIVVHIRCAVMTAQLMNSHYKASIRSNSTTTDGDEETPLVANLWEDFSQDWVNNPADSQAWEWSDIDALQIGANIECNWMEGQARCTQVYVVVYYTPSGPPADPTKYLSGNDCPVFPHEMDLVSDKLPCPPPHD